MAEISERGRARALIAAWKLRAETAEARLAEVEAKLAEMTADRDRESDWRNINADRFRRQHQRANAAKRKLAAVRDLCDEAVEGHLTGEDAVVPVWQVRALLATVDDPAEDRHEFVPKDVPAFSVFCAVCDSSKGHSIHRAAVDDPAGDDEGEHPFVPTPAMGQRCQTCGEHITWHTDAQLYRAAVDPPDEHWIDTAPGNGPNGRRSFCWPCSQVAQDYVEDCEIRDQIAAANRQRAAVDPPADHIAIFDGPPMRAAVDGPAEAHPFHMNSYVGPQPRCWCDRYADDPIHRSAGSGAGSTQDGDET